MIADFGLPCLPWCDSPVGCSTTDKPGLGQGLRNTGLENCGIKIKNPKSKTKMLLLDAK